MIDPLDDEIAQNFTGESLDDEPRDVGDVKWFDTRKGYGFIQREGTSDVFVHFTSIDREKQVLREGERVEFTVVSGEKGPEARHVTVLVESL